MRKVLLVTDSFLPLVDGVTKFSCDIVDSLKKSFEFRILAPDYGLRLNDYNGVPVRYFRTNKMIRINAGSVYHPAIPSIFSMLGEVRKTNVVFVQSLPYMGAMGIIASRLAKKKVAMYFHQIGWEQLKLVVPGKPWFKNLVRLYALVQMRYICNRCDVIMVPSEEISDILKKEGIKAKTAVVKLGVDTERFKPCRDKAAAKKRIGIPANSTVLGYCGRMSEEKDVITLIQAFLKVSKKRKSLYLLLVGDGQRLEEFTLKNRNIKITGFVSDVVPYYDAMDIFVMPSLTETTGLSTVEAMSSGVPIITTPVGIALTGISEGYNGFIFSRSDVKALSGLIDKLLSDRKLRESLSKNGREFVLSNYSWDLTAKEVKNVLESL